MRAPNALSNTVSLARPPKGVFADVYMSILCATIRLVSGHPNLSHTMPRLYATPPFLSTGILFAGRDLANLATAAYFAHRSGNAALILTRFSESARQQASARALAKLPPLTRIWNTIALSSSVMFPFVLLILLLCLCSALPGPAAPLLCGALPGHALPLLRYASLCAAMPLLSCALPCLC